MKMTTFLIFLISFSFLFLPKTFAQVTQDTELTYKEIKYVCTGVGESKEDPRWSKYPLKLMFAGAGRAYVSYVKVQIKDAAGNMAFESDCDGPWLLVQLKPGKYDVTATALKKYTRSASISVKDSGQTEYVFRFTEVSEGH